jgi:creatinine amidohydrolase
MSARWWADLKASDFNTVDPMETIAVLPVAAVEQHGPHLPLGTDTIIAEGMLARMFDTCPEAIDLRVLPIQTVGKSNEHLWAKGTLTLSATTALTAWGEIGASVARAGVKKLVIVNSHGGNLDLISILSRELRIAHKMLAVTCGWGDFEEPSETYSPREQVFGIHGGDWETSLMLAFRPDSVDMSKAADFASSAEKTLIPPTGRVSYGWIASDINPAGVAGEAHLATAEKGEITARHQVAGFLALMENVRQMPLFED